MKGSVPKGSVRWRLARVWVALAMGIASVLASSFAVAHPHGWIDLSVRIITDSQGVATGLHQTWRMDPFYSLVVFEELQQVEDASLEAGLDQLGQDIRDNLSHQHYFTDIRLDGEPQALGEVTEYTALERDGRLTYMFILPLASPQPLAGRILEYRVFDPSYYIEVVHEAEGNVVLDSALILNGEPGCALSVLSADPDPEVVLQAALLDVDEEGEPGLGQYFAETGQVDCR